MDAIGDLYTSGYLVIGKYKGYKSGHGVTNNLLRKVFADPSCYEIVDFEQAVSFNEEREVANS
ncbi:MAG: UDP-3-O-(3-hydroxymyristoyl) N-acetylglucosamine deacetylase [Alphaproteobacteria bacterium ADurb.Bin438]|nr:MAG: UDP-3-O-(3-hydroxymyristoyl) N-acetylglucosamine deacetylase [Alphaproteobacteria bacterium ADurb.Bin438]